MGCTTKDGSVAGNPYLDLNWWAEFIVSDEACKDEMLTRAMCNIKALPFAEYEALAKLFMDLPEYRSQSGYGGPFDKRYLYPLHIGFRITVIQTPGRLDLHTVDRHQLFEEKTILIAKADTSIDWSQAYQRVIEDIVQEYPHIPAWQDELCFWQTFNPADLEE